MTLIMIYASGRYYYLSNALAALDRLQEALLSQRGQRVGRA